MVRLRWLVWLGGFSVAAAGCDRAVPVAEAKAVDAAPRDVVVAPVERGPVNRPVRASGLVRPKQAHNLSFKVGGSIRSVEVEEGAHVKKGQVLARLDPTEYSASAEQARRSSEKAERDLVRARTLQHEGAIPKSNLDDAETAAAMARSTVSIAGFNERHTVLLAPAAGIVESRLAEPGEVVSPGRPIVAFLGTDRGWVVDVALTDKDAVALRSGQAAVVTLDALPGVPIAATIGDVARVGNVATGTFNAEIVLPHELPIEPKSGLVAKVSIDRLVHPAAVVPIEALVDGEADRAAVFTVDAGKASRKTVRVEFLTEKTAALSTDLAGLDNVVVRGCHDLVDGAPVAVASAGGGR
ncbi:MAG: efflux RND transporter periplasmic adaptor subunit [Polyangiaceae bacterium]|nr:efflux RND transporter periplasmic adaptor subunit [Polyangiaceae bacterium]